MSERTVSRRKDGPYVGPNPLEFTDRIFGRGAEIAELLDQLTADRIVLLHSPSGCGKTSLIEAGLRKELPGRRFFALPTIRAGRADSDAAGHPRNPLLRSVLDCLEKPLPDSGIALQWPARSAGLHFAEFLDTRTPEPLEIEGRTYQLLIFDQFEEVLTAPCQEADRVVFFKEVAVALQNRHRWALFSMREDYLGPLEPYLIYLPTQLSSRFRLKGLSVPNAQLAIREPAALFGVEFEAAAAERLAEYLAGVRASEGEGASNGAADTNEVEPVQLQVVCDHIWRQKRESPSKITLGDLYLTENEPGKTNTVDQALGEYYSARVQEVAGKDEELQRKIREWFDRELITADGFRRPVAMGAVPLGADVVQELIDHYLIRKDPRGSAIWLELAHDRLVRAVRRENEAWLRGHLQTWQVRAREWQDSGRQKYLLIFGDYLRSAQEWKESNPDRVRKGTLDWDFLEASEVEDRILSSTQRYRFHAFCVIVALMLLCVLLVVGMAGSVHRWRQSLDQLAFTSAKTEQAKALLSAAKAEAIKATLEARNAKEEAAAYQQNVVLMNNELVASQAKLAGLRSQNTKMKEDTNRLAVDRDRLVGERDRAAEERNRAIQDQQNAINARDEAIALAKTEDDLLKGSRIINEVRDMGLKSGQAPSHEAVDLAASAIEILPENAAPDDFARTKAALASAMARSLESDTDRIDFSTNQSVISLGSANSGGCIMAVNPSGQVRASPVGNNTDGCAKFEHQEQLVAWAKAGDFSVSKNEAAIGLSTGQVVVLNLGDGESQTFQPHHHSMVSVALSADGRYLAASCSLWTFSVWDLQHERKGAFHPRKVYLSPGIFSRVTSAAFGGTTQLINGVALFQASDWTSPDDGYVGVAAEDGSIAIHRLNSSRRLLRIPGPYEGGVKPRGHSGAALSVAFSPDGKSLVSGGDDQTARVWDLRDGERRWKGRAGLKMLVDNHVKLAGCPGAATTVAVSPDNALVGTGCSDGVIRLYDLAQVRSQKGTSSSLDPIEQMSGHTGGIRQIRFDATLRMLISSSSDRTIRVWRIPQLEDLQTRKAVRARIDALRSGATVQELRALAAESRRSAKLGSLQERWYADGRGH